MEKSKVAIIRCEEYIEEDVVAAVSRGLELIGGVEQFVKKGERIVLKPNFLAPDPPEKCSTTHPMVFYATAKALKEAGAKLSYGDSPGFGTAKSVAKKNGTYEYGEKLGIPIGDFENGKEVSYEKGVQNKKFTIVNAVLEADGVVSIPKLKTHALERFTGCVKNQLGVVPGLLKGEFHVRLPDPTDFARMLVDLNAFVSPRLYVMDGVMAMEGNGPRSGNPKKMGVILISADPVALDATVCRMIGLNPEYVPTVTFGEEVGHGKYKEDEIELVGDSFDAVVQESFKVENSPLKPFKKHKGLVRLVKNAFVAKPVILKDKCVKCGVCVRMCPANPKAVDFPELDTTKVPKYDYKECIRCYCCQEMCPESAIVVKKPLLRHILPF